MPWLQCPDNTCIFSIEPRYSSRNFMILHLRNKPMNKIVELSRKYKVCKNPEIENYETLAELLADKSVVEMED